MPGVKAPFLISSSGVRACLGNLRMLIVGPTSDSGGMMTLTREPSGRRASTIGLLSSTRRPSGATMRSTIRMTSSLSRNLMSALFQLAVRSTKTCWGPLTSTSVTVSSCSNVSSGPSPRMSAMTMSKMSLRSIRLSGNPSSADRLVKDALHDAAHFGRIAARHSWAQFGQQPLLDTVAHQPCRRCGAAFPRQRAGVHRAACRAVVCNIRRMNMLHFRCLFHPDRIVFRPRHIADVGDVLAVDVHDIDLQRSQPVREVTQAACCRATRMDACPTPSRCASSAFCSEPSGRITQISSLCSRPSEGNPTAIRRPHRVVGNPGQAGERLGRQLPERGQRAMQNDLGVAIHFGRSIPSTAVSGEKRSVSRKHQTGRIVVLEGSRYSRFEPSGFTT